MPDSDQTSKPPVLASRYLLSAAAFVVVVAGMRAAGEILVPFLLSAFIAVLLMPIMDWLHKRGTSTVVALIVVILIVVLVGGGFVYLIGRSVNEFGSHSREYRSRLATEVRRIEVWLIDRGLVPREPKPPVENDGRPDRSTRESQDETDQGEPPNGGQPQQGPFSGEGRATDEASTDTATNDDDRSVEAGRDGDLEQDVDAVVVVEPAPEQDDAVSDDLGPAEHFAPEIAGEHERSPPDIFAGSDPQDAVAANGSMDQTRIVTSDMVWQLVQRMVGEVGNMVRNTIVIVLTVMFMLLEASRFPAKLEAVYQGSPQSLRRVDAIIDNVRRYLAIKTLTSALTGLMAGIFVAVMGVEYAALWGLLAFLLNYIPYIGSIIAAVPPILLALVGGDIWVAVWMAVGYLIINNIVSSVIEPVFMGQGLGLSTLVVFLSLIFWGWVLGPVGMLLSAPLTMALKISLEEFEDTRWIAVLLGPRAPVETAEAAD